MVLRNVFPFLLSIRKLLHLSKIVTFDFMIHSPIIDTTIYHELPSKLKIEAFLLL